MNKNEITGTDTLCAAHQTMKHTKLTIQKPKLTLLLLVAIMIFSFASAYAVDPVMIKNINTDKIPNNLEPHNLTSLNKLLIFSGHDETHGRELWKSDGTEAGTVLLKDINTLPYTGKYPFEVSDSLQSYGNPFFKFNNSLFFAASDGYHGFELWKTDGTAPGTVLVKDINPTPISDSSLDVGHSHPSNFAVLNGVLYFWANDGVRGKELWKTDGTERGTVLVKDINAGNGKVVYWYADNQVIMNGKLYFSANDGVNGWELWTSDGTTSGTVLVKNINTEPYATDDQGLDVEGSSIPEKITAINGLIYFRSAYLDKWYKSNGTAAGTVEFVPNPGNTTDAVEYPITINGTHYLFTSGYFNISFTLRKTVGSEVGTLLLDLGGNNVIAPDSFANLNGILYFITVNTNGVPTLWKSNGTKAGTVQVKNLPSTSPGQYYIYEDHHLTVVNNTLYFTYTSSANGNELWKSDGTAAGTVLVKDIIPGANDFGPQNLMNHGGILYFSMHDKDFRYQLWKTDGTVTGTKRVNELKYIGGESSLPRNITVINGNSFFFANSGGERSMLELWKSDGSSTGTVKISTTLKYPNTLTNINGTLYFIATDNTELWKSDGTVAGTKRVKNFAPGRIGSWPSGLIHYNQALIFIANDGVHGSELWKSDGTEAGTTMIKDIMPGTADSNPVIFPDLLNGQLIFSATDAINGTELWRISGSGITAELIKNINTKTVSAPGVSPATGHSNPTYLSKLNNQIYFSASDADNGTELWKTDGTNTGTVMVKNINPTTVSGPGPLDTGHSNPSFIANYNGNIFFSARDNGNGVELWKSNGTAAGTVLVKNINSAAVSGPDPSIDTGHSSPQFFASMNNVLFFVATDATHGRELWKTDGTRAGTVMVTDFNPNANFTTIKFIGMVNNALYFSPIKKYYGTELWKTDGTSAGTTLVKSIVAETDCDSLSSFMPSPGNALYFAVGRDDGQCYRTAHHELWTSDGTAAGTQRINNMSVDTVNFGNFNFGDLGYFAADDGVNGMELWRLGEFSSAVTTVERSIVSGSDDAEENASGNMFLSSSDLELVYDGSDQTVGLRFTNLTIPKGALIKDAWIQFETDEVTSTSTTLKIQGELTANPITFSASTSNINLRPHTPESVAWVPSAWSTVGARTTAQRTPSLTPIVQKLVNQSAWANGNAMVMIIHGSGKRVAKSFETSAAAAPRLHIEYK